MERAERISSSTELAELLPRWTAHVAADSSVRDPLGFSAVSHRLTDELIPGIITTTYWARYYAVYCWILWHIREHEMPRSEPDNARAFRRREAAFALATVLDGTDIAPLGANEVRRVLAESGATLPLDFQLLDSRYGGFGSTYGGSMKKLGLFRPGTRIHDEVTEGIATDLARAVDDAVRDTPFITKKLWQRDAVERADLVASAPAMGLGAIRRNDGAAERSLIVDLMFAFDPRVESAGLRPQTLALQLWIVGAYEDAGLACPVYRVQGGRADECLLYAPLYAGLLVDITGAAPLPPVPAPLADCADLWVQFCAHQFLTYAGEQLFAAVVAVLEPDRGVSLDEVVEHLSDRAFIEHLESVTQQSAATPAALVASLGAGSTPASNAHLGPVAEYACFAAACPSEQARAATAVLLLALLTRRIERGLPRLPAGLRADGHLYAADVPALIRSWNAPAATWPAELRSLIVRFLGQHRLVMASRRGVSPWLTVDGDRLTRGTEKVEPDVRGSRLWPAAHILRDIQLIVEVTRAGASCWRSTPDGRATLRRALERWS